MFFHDTNQSILNPQESSIFNSRECKLAYMQSTADRIKKKRNELGWSQQTLANKVGVTNAAVSQWENGDTKGLKPDNLLATGKALGVTVQWLVTGEQAAPPPVATVIDGGIVAQIIREIRQKWHPFPDDDELATLIAKGYSRVMLRIQDSDRDKVESIVDQPNAEGRKNARNERDHKGKESNE